ncbi:MAG TPA: O-antigen translocase [Candidatus Gastranaerophilales bacterium]|nr:O-antigen translocase [Candidatus Gastranaerophilales bacterium]
MNLIKTSFFSGLATLIKIAGGFLTNKLIAVYAGPSGMAIIGQFQNVLGVFCDLSSGGILSGTIKYIAENSDNPSEQKKYLSVSFFISIAFALLLSLILLFLHKSFSIYFLKDIKYNNIFLVLAFAIVLISLNNFFISVLNGFKEMKKLITLQMVSNIASILFLLILVSQLGLYGALLALTTSHILVFLVSLYFVTSSKWFNIQNFISRFDFDAMKNLFKFSFIAIIVIITVPLTQIIIRDYMISTVSIESAGMWQGVLKISDVYLILLTSSIGIYFYPKVSEIKDKKELRKELINAFLFIIPMVSLMAIFIYFCRDFIIYTLFTQEFLPMKSLFGFQLVGDVFKVCCWLLMTILIAKSMFKKYLTAHFVYTFFYISTSILFINNYGIIGSTLSYAFSYIILLILLIYIFRDLLLPERFKNE